MSPWSFDDVYKNAVDQEENTGQSFGGESLCGGLGSNDNNQAIGFRVRDNIG